MIALEGGGIFTLTSSCCAMNDFAGLYGNYSLWIEYSTARWRMTFQIFGFSALL
jgi:hypothetical protein